MRRTQPVRNLVHMPQAAAKVLPGLALILSKPSELLSSGLSDQKGYEAAERAYLVGVSLMAITPWSGMTTVKLPVNTPRSFFWYRSRTVACAAASRQVLALEEGTRLQNPSNTEHPKTPRLFCQNCASVDHPQPCYWYLLIHRTSATIPHVLSISRPEGS